MTREPTSSNIIITAPAIKTIISNRKRDIPIPRLQCLAEAVRGPPARSGVVGFTENYIKLCCVGNVSRLTAQIRNRQLG